MKQISLLIIVFLAFGAAILFIQHMKIDNIVDENKALKNKIELLQSTLNSQKIYSKEVNEPVVVIKSDNDYIKDTTHLDNLIELTARIDLIENEIQKLNNFAQTQQKNLAPSPDAVAKRQQTPEERRNNQAEKREARETKLSQKMYSERIDDVWASETENKLTTALENGVFSSSIIQTDCRSTLCKVTVIISSTNTGDDLIDYENELLAATGHVLPNISNLKRENREGEGTVFTYYLH